MTCNKALSIIYWTKNAAGADEIPARTHPLRMLAMDHNEPADNARSMQYPCSLSKHPSVSTVVVAPLSCLHVVYAGALSTHIQLPAHTILTVSKYYYPRAVFFILHTKSNKGLSPPCKDLFTLTMNLCTLYSKATSRIHLLLTHSRQ